MPLIQLPDDVIAAGYNEVRPFQWDQIFHSESADFTGTMREFVEAGMAYEYYQLDRFRRVIIPQKEKCS